MRVGSGKVIYQWIDNWAKIPATEDAKAAWAHPGIVATEAGEIITAHQDGSSLLLFDRQGG